MEFIRDLKGRVTERVELTTDKLHAYVPAIRSVFGSAAEHRQTGKDIENDASTSYVERHNLTMRMSMKRFTRKSNAFSKKVDNHALAVALHTVFYNWVRPHRSLDGKTPAMAAGLTDRPYGMDWIVELTSN